MTGSSAERQDGGYVEPALIPTTTLLFFPNLLLAHPLVALSIVQPPASLQLQHPPPTPTPITENK